MAYVWLKAHGWGGGCPGGRAKNDQPSVMHQARLVICRIQYFLESGLLSKLSLRNMSLAQVGYKNNFTRLTRKQTHTHMENVKMYLREQITEVSAISTNVL